MLFWGMSFVWTKIVLEVYNPITIVFLRLIISSVFLLVIFKITKLLQLVKKEDYKIFFLSALFEPLLYFLGENFGLKEVSSTIASVIIATIPLVTPVFALFIIKEKITIFQIIGIAISFIGILLMVVDKNLNLTASPNGIILMFMAVFSTVGYGVTIKKLSLRYNSFSIIAYQNLIGVFYFLPFFLIFDYKEFIKITPSVKSLSALFQLAIFASSLAFMCYIQVVKRIGVSRANVFSNLIPIVTAVFSFFILDEKFYIQKIIGILIVILGVFLSQSDKIFKRKFV